MSRKREYDRIRYDKTSNTLKEGIRKLRKKNNKKEVTKYALSKFTNVTRKTIDNHPEILEVLNSQKEIDVRDIVLNIDKISSFEEAVGIIKEIDELYKNKNKKLKKLFKTNTSLNNKIVKLKKENRELKEIIRGFKEKNK